MAENQTSISWEAWEYKHYEKNVGWYAAFIAITILVMGFFIIVESDVFAAVSLGVIAVLMLLFSRHRPKRVQIELGERGIKFGGLLYPYKQLKYFWVVHNERHQTINLHTTALINNTLILELEDQDPAEIRNFLLRHLSEHTETEETSAQRIMHWFKF